MINAISGFSVRRPVFVVLVWLAVVGVGFGVGTGVFDRLEGDVGRVSGSESERAAHRIAEIAPHPETLTAVVSGLRLDDPDARTHVDTVLTATRDLPGVASVSEPDVSAETGDALIIRIVLAPGQHEDAARAVADQLHELDAPAVAVSGGPLRDAELNEQAQKDVVQAELLSMPVVLVLLFLIFGGLLAAGLPLLVATAGIAGTFGVLYAFSTVSDVSVYAIQVTTMLAVGLGVDYALLIVSRFREQRRTAPDVAAAIAAATATAGRTVAFSGLTVAVALSALVVFPEPFLRSMGLAGAAVVLVDMAAALTLLPALLALFGHRIGPARPRRGNVFARVAHGVQARPLLTLVVTAGVLVTLASPVLGLRLGDADPRMLPTNTQTRQLWDELAVHFPDQTGGSTIRVVVDAPADDPAVERFRDDVGALPGAASVRLEDAGRLATVLPVALNAPPEEAAAQDTVHEIRAMAAPFDVEVTGDAARMVDFHTMLVQRLPWAIAVLALGTLMLLFAFTGSLVLPIKAVLTNLFSIGAALGVVVWIFQDGNLAGLFGTEGLGYLNVTVPLLVGAIAFGLSVDYEVFLLSRMRERWLAGASPRDAVADGLQRTGGIVTAAALVIAVVFAGFIAGGFAPIKAVGLGLVVAIVLDVTVVRMLLVPATMTLLGRRNWWLPGPLRALHSRLTPTVPYHAADEDAGPHDQRCDAGASAGQRLAGASSDQGSQLAR